MARAIDGDTADIETAVYHIVCHDCRTEFICRSEYEAERRTSHHRSSTGHNIEYAALRGEGTETSLTVENE